jgi:hypothetical protein
MAYLCAQLLPWVRGRKVRISVREREQRKEREWESRGAEDEDIRTLKIFLARCCTVQS